jgi:hypothetical protein
VITVLRVTPRSAEGTIEEAGATAARVPWTRRLARLGFVCKAVAYAVVAALTIGAALGLVGFDPTDTRGALIRIGRGIAGRGLVLLLATGFLGLAIWFVVEAAWNPRPGSRGLWSVVSRLGQAGGGIGYLALAIWAGQYAILAESAVASDAVVKAVTADLLATRYGVVLVLVAAMVMLIVGLRQIRVGVGRGFESWLALDRMRPAVRRWGARLGTVGFSTQGAVFTLVGLSLGAAVVDRRASDAKGFDGVLGAIGGLPYGRVALGLAGLGLLAYAAFAVVEGRYKRMNPR